MDIFYFSLFITLLYVGGLKALFFFLFVIFFYLLIAYIYPGLSNASTRNKIMFSTWSKSTQGNIVVRLKIDMTNSIQFINSFQNQKKPTITHIVIKALGQIIRNTPGMNRKICFGKFKQFQKVNISCLVDIEQGKVDFTYQDLASILVQQVENKTIQDIRDFINTKAKQIKQYKGDQDHKKRVNPLKRLPTLLVGLVIEIGYFLTNYLGLDLKELGLKKDQFGVAMVSNVGVMNLTDATAPLTRKLSLIAFSNCVVIASVNKMMKEGMVIGQQIKIVDALKVNFILDHRYIDGGSCKRVSQIFYRVFQNPWQYSASKKNE